MAHVPREKREQDLRKLEEELIAKRAVAEFLQEQTDLVDRELGDLERRVTTFRYAHQVILGVEELDTLRARIGPGDPSTLTETSLRTIETALSTPYLNGCPEALAPAWEFLNNFKESVRIGGPYNLTPRDLVAVTTIRDALVKPGAPKEVPSG